MSIHNKDIIIDVEGNFELLPCPFCGNSNVHTGERDNYRVINCLKCGSECHEASWNKRSDETVNLLKKIIIGYRFKSKNNK